MSVMPWSVILWKISLLIPNDYADLDKDLSTQGQQDGQDDLLSQATYTLTESCVALGGEISSYPLSPQ